MSTRPADCKEGRKYIKTTITVTDLPLLPNATIGEDPFIARIIQAPNHTAPATPQHIIHILDFTPVLCSKTGGINPPSTPQASYRNMSIDSNVTPLRVYSSPKKACLDGAMRNYTPGFLLRQN